MSWRDRLRLLHLSARSLAGRRFWLASLLPARRAARTDPLTVMRTE